MPGWRHAADTELGHDVSSHAYNAYSNRRALLDRVACAVRVLRWSRIWIVFHIWWKMLHAVREEKARHRYGTDHV